MYSKAGNSLPGLPSSADLKTLKKGLLPLAMIADPFPIYFSYATTYVREIL